MKSESNRNKEFKYMIRTPMSLIEKTSERNKSGVPLYHKDDLLGYEDDFV